MTLNTDVVLTERSGRVLLVTLNRPETMNAIDADVARGLISALTELESTVGLTAAVLTGAGRGFCAGMDLKAYASAGIPRELFSFVKSVTTKPLIAAIEGFALAGGLEIALTCDLIVAARGAKLGIPEVGLGLIAAAGGLLRLPRRLPYGVAMEMALTGDPITAEQAFEHGLVARLTKPGETLDVALQLAERIARNAPLAVCASKQLVRDTQAWTDADYWDAQGPHWAVISRSADATEGPLAFAEKREPVWSGL